MQNTNISGANTKVKRRALNNRFLFLEPAPSEDAHNLSTQLALQEGIEKVYLSEGDYGFMIKIKAMGESKLRDVIQKIESKGTCKRVETFYEYSKVTS